MEITKEQMVADINDIISVLNDMLALNPKGAQITNLLELIFEGEHIENSYEAIQKYILKVYYSYGDNLKLDKSVMAVANKSITTEVDIDWGFKEETLLIVLWLMELLENYVFMHKKFWIVKKVQQRNHPPHQWLLITTQQSRLPLLPMYPLIYQLYLKMLATE